MTVKKSDIRQLHVGKSFKEKQEYLNSLRPYYNYNKTEEKPSIFDKTDSSSSNERDKPLETPQVKSRSLRLIITDFVKGNWGVTIIGGLIVGILVVVVVGYFTLLSDQKAQEVKISDIQKGQQELSRKQENLNDKNANLNTDFQVFKAGIIKDIEYIKYKIGMTSK